MTRSMVAVAAGLQIEARWAGLTSPEELDVLRASLRSLLATLQPELAEGADADNR